MEKTFYQNTFRKKLILDSNVIFSVLISGNRKILKLLKENEIYAPDYILLELNKYEEMIVKKTKSIGFKELIIEIFKEITIVPMIYIDKKNRDKAKKICKDTDIEDSPYIALVLQFGDATFITRDKKLIECAKRNGIDVMDLKDIL